MSSPIPPYKPSSVYSLSNLFHKLKSLVSIHLSSQIEQVMEALFTELSSKDYSNKLCKIEASFYPEGTIFIETIDQPPSNYVDMACEENPSQAMCREYDV